MVDCPLNAIRVDLSSCQCPVGFAGTVSYDPDSRAFSGDCTGVLRDLFFCVFKYFDCLTQTDYASSRVHFFACLRVCRRGALPTRQGSARVQLPIRVCWDWRVERNGLRRKRVLQGALCGGNVPDRPSSWLHVRVRPPDPGHAYFLGNAVGCRVCCRAATTQLNR